MSIFKQHVPLITGLLAIVACISVGTLIYRALGMGKSEALYLACLTFATLAYLTSRRTIRDR